MNQSIASFATAVEKGQQCWLAALILLLVVVGAPAPAADLGAADGKIIATLKEEQSFLDSMAVETDGALVVGTLCKGCVSVIQPSGELQDQLYFPERFITSIAFGGKDMRTTLAASRLATRLLILPARKGATSSFRSTSSVFNEIR